MQEASQANFVPFTEEMRRTHTILVPGMLPIHFSLMQAAFTSCGYKVEVLQDTGHEVVETGLKYVNNDICYPALLVIGQLLHALESGKYDLNKTALIITQTGGGCRASNYIYLLHKALEKAGLSHIPVISLNVNGLEKQPGFHLDASMLRKFLAALIYGDAIMYLSNKIRPYEVIQGTTDALTQKWLSKLGEAFTSGKAQALSNMKKLTQALASEFAKIPIVNRPKTKVGIVGEIYIKYAALGNNNLEKFLQKQDCEYMLPGVLNFVMYCVDTYLTDYKLYGGSFWKYGANKGAMWYLKHLESILHSALETATCSAPATYEATKAMVKGIIGYGNNMGEGWLLTAEMLELVHSGYTNIICAQPFGCLPNHIAGRGMINKIKEIADEANILAIDYDASASKVNQENRIKLMLATAK